MAIFDRRERTAASSTPPTQVTAAGSAAHHDLRQMSSRRWASHGTTIVTIVTVAASAAKLTATTSAARRPCWSHNETSTASAAKANNQSTGSHAPGRMSPGCIVPASAFVSATALFTAPKRVRDSSASGVATTTRPAAITVRLTTIDDSVLATASPSPPRRLLR